MDVNGAVVLLNTAGLGVVAYLLLIKVDARLSALERSINRFVLVQALDLIRRPETPAPVKREARELVKQISAAKNGTEVVADFGARLAAEEEERTN